MHVFRFFVFDHFCQYIDEINVENYANMLIRWAGKSEVKVLGHTNTLAKFQVKNLKGKKVMKVYS